MIDTVEKLTTQPADRVTRDLMQLRETAGKVVGRVFFSTLLKQMRESNLRGEYGHGGRGEEVFSAQLHDIIAERLGTAGGSTLTEAVYQTYERQQRTISEYQRSVMPEMKL